MERALKIILLAGMLLFACVMLLKPIDDPDFWWHLRAGEYITHEGLPDRDPFAFTSPRVPELRERLVITSYWPVQLLYYGAFAFAGLKGIIALRVVVVALICWSVMVRMRRYAADTYSRHLVTGLALLSLLTCYTTQDRPQTFSFLFFSLLMGLLEMPARGRWRGRSLLLFPLMAVWANCHGGVIMGDAALVLYALSCAMEQRRAPRQALSVVLWAGAGVAASLINPNSYHVVTVPFSLQQQVFTQYISEYADSFSVAVRHGNWQVISYWLMLGLVAAGVFLGRGRPLAQTLIALFVGVMSVRYIRNIAFLSIGLAPLAAPAAARLSGIFTRLRPADLLAKSTAVLLLCLSFLHYGKQAVASGSFRREVSDIYPEQAAGFISRSGLSGNMFNEYGWGGFFIWRLYPEHKVFIDGRVIYESVFEQYMSVSRGDMTPVAGLPAWQAYLEAYRVDFVVMQLFNRFSGQLYPVMVKLLKDPRWHPVYLDHRAFIFVKDSERNREVISRHAALDSNSFMRAMLLQLGTIERNSPGSHQTFIAKAEVLWYLGRYGEAERSYLRALALAPGNETALNELKSLRDYLRK